MMGGGIRHTTVPGANNSENWIFPNFALLSANGGVAKKLGESDDFCLTNDSISKVGI